MSSERSGVHRIGVLTGGGDAPGLNAVIRAVVKSAHNGIACLGLEDSFDGLIELNRAPLLTPKDVTGILRIGGTILGRSTAATRSSTRSKRATASATTRSAASTCSTSWASTAWW